MNYRLEQIIKQAGIPEEDLVETRKIYDAEKKRLKRDKQLRRKYGITFSSLEAFVNDEEYSEPIEFADPNVDVEAEVMKNIEKEMIHECLKEMKKEDSDFLKELYWGQYGIETAMAAKYGLTRSEFRTKHKNLVEELGRIFFKKYGKF